MNLFKGDGRTWEWRPFPDSELKLHFPVAPNAFHRFMQRWLLGFRWTRT